MCGVCGVFGGDPGAASRTAHRLNEWQRRRGPDHEAVVRDGPFHLGSTRLAIQDPTPAANQPMRSPDGRFAVVFNGEIYNFRELISRHRLEVRTGADTEVVALLWSRFGPSCLRQFRGMYALAVADLEARRLHLARDPFGIKPLYWRTLDGALVFASDAKALWRTDRLLPVDRHAIREYLAWGAIGIHRSPWHGIRAVPPGDCLSFTADGAHLLEDSIDPFEIGAADGSRGSAALAEAFRSTVAAHLEADVPSALLLAAGVDSSLIALAAAELGTRLHCVTVTGDVGEDESWQARATAKQFGHQHETVPASFGDAAVGEFFEAMPRPTIDGLNSFLVFRAVHDAGFKVALSGLGGDEALGGYPYARSLPLLPLLEGCDRLFDRRGAGLRERVVDAVFPSPKVRRLVSPGGPRTAPALVDLGRELFDAPTVDRLLGTPPGRSGGGFREDPAEASMDRSARLRPRQAMICAEVRRYMQPMLLQDTDAFSMASSVEARVPFVDVPFFSAALASPSVRGKRGLADAMGDPYLRLLSRRPKSGFSVPMQQWLETGPLREVVADALAPNAPVWSLIDRTAGSALLRAPSADRRWSEPWAIAALDGWLRSLA